jgi:transcription-repair coupling factor (superfamily II helicase)
LRDQCPELTYVVAHGQMAAGELDDRMNAFYDGEIRCVLATTIVESGLDIPTANTIVIHRADMFGCRSFTKFGDVWGGRKRAPMPI